MADTLKVQPEEQKESQEHVDEMVAKAEGKKTQEPQETQETTEEQLLAGKYKTEEDLQKGILELLKKDKGEDLEALYKNLESEVLNQSKEKPKDTTVPNETKDETDVEVEEVEEEMEEADVDFSKYEEEFFEKGTLSKESYNELKEKGFSKNIVDNYITGVKAKADKQAQEVYNITDGEENYTKMIDWADSNLESNEKEAFNQAVTSGNQAQAKFAVEALYGRYAKAEGGQPQRVIKGGKVPQNNSGSFQSRAEVIEAMNSPKYQTDSAYRAEVERKLRNSNVF